MLPSRFPNLLVNGSSGIAVGMATNIPSHNLCEVIDGICALIDNPDIDVFELMDYIKGPDFPTGGIIMGYSGIRAAYATGRGRIIVRARTEIEETSSGRFRIVISEIPYQVNKLNLVKSSVELADDKRVEGIRDVVDHSDREGLRVVIDLTKDANPQVVLNQLFKYTQMQVTFGAIMLTLVNGIPRVLTLKEMLEEYVKFQSEVIERRTRYDLRKAKEREHILEALKKASDFIDEVIRIIRNAPDIPTAKTNLMERFQFDDVQADAIVKMRLGQLAGLERQKIEDELGNLLLKIAEYESILADHGKVLAIVKDECLKMRDKYGDERRTSISMVSGEVDIEDLIPEEDSVITMTRMGYMKRQAADVYKAQRRGGRGIRGMTTREEDVADQMLLCSTHDYVMCFTNAGRVYRLKGYEVPEGSRTSKGMNVVNLLPLQPEEKVTMMIGVPSDISSEGRYLCMITKYGIIKRTRLDAYQNSRKNGLIAIDLDEGDSLVQVLETDGYQSLLVATREGMAIRFDENDARVIGRTARGVRALNLADGDEVVGMVTCSPDKLLLTVAETGYGRLSSFDDYRVQSRGGKGLKNYHVANYGKIAGIMVVDPEDDLILISSDGILIRMVISEIRQCRRPSKGVRIMRVADEAKIVSMVSVPHDENAETVKPTETEGADEGAEEATEEE